MVKLLKVEDKFSDEDFTERAKTDGIYTGKQSALYKRKLPERPRPQPKCGAKRENFSFANFLP